MKMVCLYGPDRDDKIVETATGPIIFKEYLKREKSRIEKNPNRIVQIISKLGFSSLIVDDIATNDPLNNWTNLMPKGQRRPRNRANK